MQMVSQVETSIITKLEVLNYFVLAFARFGQTIRLYTTGYSPTAYIRGFHEALIQSLSNFEVTEIERLPFASWHCLDLFSILSNRLYISFRAIT